MIEKSNGEFVYLDNSSTCHPKPDCVWEAARDYLQDVGVSPGRAGGARAATAEGIVSDARRVLMDLFGGGDPRLVSFTANATHALNLAIRGMLKLGDHVITTVLEHNSVLRPLELLRRQGVITYDVLPIDGAGALDLAALPALVKPATRLLIVNHASNVIGSVAPLDELGAFARGAGIAFAVDASQSAGWEDIDVDRSHIDVLCFTGHKGLAGPSGVGGIFTRSPDDLEPLLVGGTGLNSQSLLHPDVAPTKFEAGTLNYLGIAGLRASVAYVTSPEQRRKALGARLLAAACADGLRQIRGVTVYGRPGRPGTLPVFSFNIGDLYSREAAAVLDDEFGIVVRSGLHCAPLAHSSLGTSPQGSARVSLGRETTEHDVCQLLRSVEVLAARYGS